MLERIKKDPVLFISGILAIVSCFFIHPDMEYLGYIDFRVLAILFCMMLVVSKLVILGVFDKLTKSLLSRIDSSRMVSLVLVWFSFFMGMILTNDVTLVTMVPFAIFKYTFAIKSIVDHGFDRIYLNLPNRNDPRISSGIAVNHIGRRL